jgi:prolipoprotein diacylglyceryltransferase
MAPPDLSARKGLRRVLFTWRGFRVHSYPAMLYLGMVAGIVAGNHASHRAGLDPLRVWLAMILLTAPALIGARLLWVATHWRRYRAAPRRIWARSEGGGSMLGSLPILLAVSLPLLDALEIPFARFWDVATFTILVGMIFTRLGCLLNGCCSGRETGARWGLDLTDHRGVRKRRVTVQILEMGLGAAGLGVALLAWSHAPFPGAVLLVALTAYSLGRLALEPLREEPDRWGSIRVHRAIAGLFAAAALAALVGGWLRAP